MPRRTACPLLLAALLALPARAESPADLPHGRSLALPGGGDFFAFALSPDGKAFASVGGDRVIRLWDVASGKELRQLKGHEAVVSALAFAPDGKRLASGVWGGVIRLWDTASGKELHRLTGHRAGVNSLAFAPDGRWLASGGGDTLIGLWDAAAGQAVAQFGRHRGEVTAVAFAPDGRSVASADDGGSARVYAVPRGRELVRLDGHRGAVQAVAFSPDGRMVASAGEDRSVRLWELAAGEERGRLDGHTDAVQAVAFAPGGLALATAGADRTVRLWDAASGKELLRGTKHRAGVTFVAFAPGGKLLSAGYEPAANLWDTAGRLAAKPTPLAPGDLPRLWGDLAGADAGRAWRAVCALGADPGRSVPFLRARLASLSPAAVARLVRDLDDDSFAVREEATAQLAALRPAAEPALRTALQGPLSLEARRRLERVLSAPPGDGLPPGRLRVLRAVEALERTGKPEAAEVLAALAKGEPTFWLTREAQAARDRLSRRPAP